jgi:tetratricopeptide (TPR) repeat protein
MIPTLVSHRSACSPTASASTSGPQEGGSAGSRRIPRTKSSRGSTILGGGKPGGSDRRFPHATGREFAETRVRPLLASVAWLRAKRTAAAMAVALAAAAGCRRAAAPPSLGAAEARLERHAICVAGPLTAGQARDPLARIRAAPGDPTAWAEAGEGWLREARLRGLHADYHAALACAEAAAELAPGDSRIGRLRAQALLGDHRFEEAQAVAAALLATRPRDLVALAVLSDALLELGRFDEAANAAQRMMDLRPSLPSYLRASHLVWLQGDVQGALEAARLALGSASPRDPEPFAWAVVHRATLLWHQGDLDGAEAGFRRALELVGEYGPALLGSGRVALARGDASGAAEILARALQARPGVEAAWALGDAREAAGDARGAAEAWREAEKLGALDARTWALFLATKGLHPQDALRLAQAERAVRADPYTEDVLAWALFRAGRIEEARAAAERAIGLGTPDPRFLFHAGAIRVACGDAGGRALVQRALELNPAFDPSGAEEARRLLAGAPAPRVAFTTAPRSPRGPRRRRPSP